MSDGMYPGAHAAATPDKPAYIMAATGEVVTYAELDAAANRLSQLLRTRTGCGPATTSRSAWRTTPATSRSPGARTTPG